MANYFFFLKPLNNILIGAFWWAFLMLVILWVPFLRVWWWVFFPLILSIELHKLYFWWMNWDFSYGKVKWVVLEIVPPKEVLVPLKAMEDVFTVMFGTNYQPPNWREKWCEGVVEDASGWMSWEIVSIEGNLHFFVRVMAGARHTLETILSSHYPELEIAEVQDYTRNVPQNMPNKEWDTYGEDFILAKPAPYPIRTYEKFFEPQGEKISAEEKRIDPLSSLLEMMSKLGDGEQYWLQFVTHSCDEPGYQSEVKSMLGKLSNRPVKKKTTFWQDLWAMLFHLIYGPKKEGSGEKATFKWLDSAKTEEGADKELLLSPGERETLTEVENKAKRPIFRVNIRAVYVAKRENFKSEHKQMARAYFGHFQTQHMNSIRYYKDTRPKTTFMFRKMIPLARTRKMFRNYVLRFTPKFPNRTEGMALLNTEEMATVWHFPIKITGLVAPTMSRVESKKGGPPPNLPME